MTRAVKHEFGGRMKMKIAEIEGLNLEIPKDSWFSFFNTPYAGHRLGTAVDVYFPDRALFPFEEGRVMEIKRVRTPRYVPVREDYLLIIKVCDFCLKVLHVMPAVKIGEKLSLYDEIGSLIVSGFFRPWSDMHAHFELRNCTDRYRARGGLLIHPRILKLVPVAKGSEFEVVEKSTHYAWLEPLKRGGKSLTPLSFGDAPIEGGIPHYHYGALFGPADEIEIFGVRTAVSERLPNGVGLFRTEFRILVNRLEVRGVGAYCNQPRIKLIGSPFDVGDVVEVRGFIP